MKESKLIPQWIKSKVETQVQPTMESTHGSFMLRVNTDNAAFEDDSAIEIARILKDVAHRVENGETSGKIRDVNGNTVGSFGM